MNSNSLDTSFAVQLRQRLASQLANRTFHQLTAVAEELDVRVLADLSLELLIVDREIPASVAETLRLQLSSSLARHGNLQDAWDGTLWLLQELRPDPARK